MSAKRKRFLTWPVGIALALGTTVVANATMLVIAQRNRPAIEASDYYERGLAWQQVIDARRASDALGWRVDVRVCPEGRGADGCAVEYAVRDAAGRPVDGLTGRLAARRSDDPALDAEASVEALGEGRYRARLPLRRGGQYRLDARLEGGAAPWLDERRATVAEGRP